MMLNTNFVKYKNQTQHRSRTDFRRVLFGKRWKVSPQGPPQLPRLAGLGSRQQHGTVGQKPEAPASPNTHTWAELYPEGQTPRMEPLSLQETFH